MNRSLFLNDCMCRIVRIDSQTQANQMFRYVFFIYFKFFWKATIAKNQNVLMARLRLALLC